MTHLTKMQKCELSEKYHWYKNILIKDGLAYILAIATAKAVGITIYETEGNCLYT